MASEAEADGAAGLAAAVSKKQKYRKPKRRCC
jgi:hypothetical protein